MAEPIPIGEPRGQSHLHLRHFADSPVAHQFAGEAEIGQRSLPASGLPHAPIALDRIANRLAFHPVVRQWLLAVDIFLLISGFSSHERMPMVGHGAHDRVNILARHQLPVIVVGLAIFVAVMTVDPVERSLQTVLVQVAKGDNLCFRW